MLEVHSLNKGFVVCDAHDGEPVMRFISRRAADDFVAEQQIAEVHAVLQRWSLDNVPAVY